MQSLLGDMDGEGKVKVHQHKFDTKRHSADDKLLTASSADLELQPGRAQAMNASGELIEGAHSQQLPGPDGSPPTSSIASGTGNDRTLDKTTVKRIQKEFELREEKLKHDLEEVKTKSRKAVSLLKVQLADAHSKHESEMESAKREMREMEGDLEKIQREAVSLKEEVEKVRRENEELSLNLRDKEREVNR